ncbi:MAG: PEP-CTERM sorting domain-containing protein [Methylotenera sp.]
MKKFLLISMFLIFASNANAGIFDGKSLQLQYFFPDLSSPRIVSSNGTYTVGPGIEVPIIINNALGSNIGNLDFQSDGFTINFTLGPTSFAPSVFSGFRITDINETIGPFATFTLGTNTGLIGSPVLTFDANNLFVNLQGLSFRPGSTQFNVTAGPFVPPPAVPEPETYAMLLAGLGLMGFVARRRKET